MLAIAVASALCIFVALLVALTVIPRKSDMPIHYAPQVTSAAGVPLSNNAAAISAPDADVPRVEPRSVDAEPQNVPKVQTGGLEAYPSCHEGSNATLKTLTSARWWVTSIVTNAWNQYVFAGPSTPRTVALLSNLPGPIFESGNKSLGAFERGFLFCEFWTVSYAAFLLDCLPRLLRGYPELVAQGHIGDPTFMIFCPGNFFAFQYLVEVLGVPERQILMLPEHLIWQFKYPNYFFEVGTLYYVPPSWDLARNVRLVRCHVLHGVGMRLHVPLKQATDTVTFSERADFTMPKHHQEFISQLQTHLPDCAVRSGRLETLPVVSQVRLMLRTKVLIGPSGWGSLLSMIFLPEDSVVVEMFASEEPLVNSYPLAWVETTTKLVQSPEMGRHDAAVMATIRSKQKPSAGMMQPISAPFLLDGGKTPTFVAHLADLLGIRYRKIFPQEPLKPKVNAVWNAVAVARALRSVVDAAATGSSRNPMPHVRTINGTSPFFSHPLIACDNLYHKSQYQKQLGLFKHVHICPDFALKMVRTGDWKRMLKEMLLLRNLSEPQITPPVALCFNQPAYAQALVDQLGRQGQNKAERLADARTWYVAMAGFLRTWESHQARGAFLFYCDPGPKNWGIPRQGKQVLQMYDLDTSNLIIPGALCSRETDCGCEFTPEDACVNHRCTKQGMQRKIDKQVYGWLKVLITLYAPRSILADNATHHLIQHVKRGAIECELIKEFIALKAPDLLVGLPYCRGRTLSRDWNWVRPPRH